MDLNAQRTLSKHMDLNAHGLASTASTLFILLFFMNILASFVSTGENVCRVCVCVHVCACMYAYGSGLGSEVPRFSSH